MIDCCIICYKKCELKGPVERASNVKSKGQPQKNEKETETLQRFFKLLERHDEVSSSRRKAKGCNFNTNHGSSDGFAELGQVLFEVLVENGCLISCPDCSVLLESFCEFYHAMKKAELFLNWKLTTLATIMLSAGRISERVHCFKECTKHSLEELEVDLVMKECCREGGELAEVLIGFRQAIVNQCFRKLSKTYPKLVLHRHQSDSTSAPTTSKLTSTDTGPKEAGNDAIVSSSGMDGHVEINYQKRTEVVESGTETAGDDASEPSQEARKGKKGGFLISKFLQNQCSSRLLGRYGKLRSSQSSQAPETGAPFLNNRENENPKVYTSSPGKKFSPSAIVPESNAPEDCLIPNSPVSAPPPSDVSFDDTNSEVIVAGVVKQEVFTPYKAPDSIVLKNPPIPLASLMTTGGDSITSCNHPSTVESMLTENSSHVLPNSTTSNVRASSRLRTVQCNRCRKTFSSKDNLAKHENEHNKGESESEQKTNEIKILQGGEDDVLQLDDGGGDDYQESEDDYMNFSDSEWNAGEEPNKLISKPAPAVTSSKPCNLDNSIDAVACGTDSVDDKTLEFKKLIKQKRKLLKDKKIQLNEEEEDDHDEIIFKNQKRFKCPDCLIIFTNVAELISHHMKIHQPLQKQTEDGVTTRSIIVDVLEFPKNYNIPGILQPKSEYTVFARIEVPNSTFYCSVPKCDATFYAKEELEGHAGHHGNFKCQFCPVEEKKAEDLALHEFKNHGKPGEKRPGKGIPAKSRKYLRYGCPRCSLRFGREMEYLHHHLSVHLSLVPAVRHSCPICQLYFLSIDESKAKLVRWVRYKNLTHFKEFHNLLNTKEEDIKRCPTSDCSAYFTSQAMFTTHRNLRHGARSERPSCSLCDKSYFDFQHLRKHMKTVHPETYYRMCPFYKACSKVLESPEAVSNHVREAHPNTKFAPCPKCPQVLIESLLPSHLRSHERKEKIEAGLLKPEASHVCEFCGKAFTNKDRLARHYLTHSGPQSWEFMCSVCSKMCLTNGKLQEHMRTHTKDKPFECQVCGLRYAHRHNLRIHINSKHGDIMEDKPRKFTWTTNFESKKGKKRKQTSGDGTEPKSKRKRNTHKDLDSDDEGLSSDILV